MFDFSQIPEELLLYADSDDISISRTDDRAQAVTKNESVHNEMKCGSASSTRWACPSSLSSMKEKQLGTDLPILKTARPEQISIEANQNSVIH